MTTDELMIKLSNGDEAAFEKLYAKTCKTVYYIALSVLRERSLAEDVIQATYFKVVQNAKQYERGTNACAWIAKIAKNEALKTKKRRGAVTFVDEFENPRVFGVGQTDDYGLLIDLARRILCEDEFAVLLLVVSEGYKRREISAILDMPVSTVTWKYNNAINKMREALKDR